MDGEGPEPVAPFVVLGGDARRLAFAWASAVARSVRTRASPSGNPAAIPFEHPGAGELRPSRWTSLPSVDR